MLDFKFFVKHLLVTISQQSNDKQNLAHRLFSIRINFIKLDFIFPRSQVRNTVIAERKSQAKELGIPI